MSNCKKRTQFICIQLLLILAILIYLALGTYVFQIIEKTPHDKLCYEGKGNDDAQRVKLREQLINYMKKNLSVDSYDTPDNMATAITKLKLMIKNYTNFTMDNKFTTYYVGQDCDLETSFNLPNILLFAITIITSIGYGHIFPITNEGKVACAIYATIGIPMFLVFIRNLSDLLGDTFRAFFFQIILKLLCRNKQKTSPSDQLIKEKIKIDTEQTKESEAIESEEIKQSVPMTITLGIISIYILFGAIIFQIFEGWSLIKGSYFCFVTLSTIGLGDLVPGQDLKDSSRNIKMILGSIYILFGLAVLAMCFDLMQNEITDKFEWLGRKLGLIKDEKEIEEIDSSSIKKDTVDI